MNFFRKSNSDKQNETKLIENELPKKQTSLFGSLSASSITNKHTHPPNYHLSNNFQPKNELLYIKAQKLEQYVSIKNRRWKLKTFKNCFIATEAIKVIIQLKFADDIGEAIEFGNHLIQTQIIKHAANKHTSFKNEYLFYQFTPLYYKYFKQNPTHSPINSPTSSHKSSTTTNGSSHSHSPNKYLLTRNTSHSLSSLPRGKHQKSASATTFDDMKLNLPQRSNTSIISASSSNRSSKSSFSPNSSYDKKSAYKKARLGSSFSFLSTSTSNSAIGLSAHSVVSISNSALSLLDYNIERKDVEAACCTLMDLQFNIKAIWIVARPINRAALKRHKFEHWCLKIHAHPALISMDFFEQSGKGAFGISSVCASWTELEDFLHYYVTIPPQNENGKPQLVKRAWKIISCVVPARYNKVTNSQKHSLPLEIGKNTNVSSSNESPIDRIKCDYKVRDIAEYIEEWVDNNKSYNTLGTNCQRFAYDVYNYLIGDYYPHKVKLLDKHLQSPLDRQKEKLKRLKNNQNPCLKEIGDEFSTEEEDYNDDNDIKQEQKQNIEIYDNPEPNVFVESLSGDGNDFIHKIKTDNDNNDDDNKNNNINIDKNQEENDKNSQDNEIQDID